MLNWKRVVGGLDEFRRDFINIKLLPYKIIYFLLIFAVVIFYIQLTVHQRSLGLSETQTGYISAFNYAFMIIFPFLTSIIAEKIGNFKYFLVIITALEAIVIFLFSIVPAVETICPILIEEGVDGGIKCVEYLNHSSNFTFWIYASVRICFTILNSTSITIFEAAVMLVTQESGEDYGKQRAWGTIGALVSAYLGGVLVDFYSIGKSKDYSLVFYVSSGMTVLCAGVMMAINISFKLPTEEITKKIFNCLKTVKALSFIGIVFFGAMFIGYVETFMYLYIDGLGASPTLIGLTVVVAAPLEFLLNIFSINIINTFGYTKTMTFCLLCYSFKFLGMGLLTSSTVKFILLLELCDAFSLGLFFTVATVYCGQLVDTSQLVTLRGILGATHGGLGKMVGALLGTWINKYLKGSVPWLAISIFPIIISIIYYLLISRNNTQKSTKMDNQTQLPLGSINLSNGDTIGSTQNTSDSKYNNKGFQVD